MGDDSFIKGLLLGLLIAAVVILAFVFGFIIGRGAPVVNPPPPCLVMGAPIAPDMLTVEVESGQGVVYPDTRTVTFKASTTVQPQQAGALIGVLRISLVRAYSYPCGPVSPPSEFYYQSVASDIYLQVSGSLAFWESVDYSIQMSIYQGEPVPVPLGILPPEPRKIAEFGIPTDQWTVSYLENYPVAVV